MKRNIKRMYLLLVMILAVSQQVSYGQTENPKRANQTRNTKNLFQVAKATPQLSTFVKAVKAADLEATFSRTDVLTVFAPSNAAFDSLPSGAKEDLLKSENKEKLKAILLNHVAKGKYTAATLTNEQTLQAIGGQELGISNLGGKIMAGGKDVSKADIMASNGVIHIINVVIIPPVEEVDANKE